MKSGNQMSACNEVKLRILYDHQIFAAQRWGGVSRYFAELAARLAKSEIVCVHAPVYVSRCLASAPREIIQGLRLPAFPGVTALANLAAKGFPPSKAFDIFHPTWYNTRGWRPRGSSVAHTVYDMIPELFPDEHPLYRRHAAAKRSAIEEADMVFCISQSTKRDLTSFFGISSEKVVVTHLGSTIQDVPPAKKPVEYPYVLYVGQRGGYKNFKSLLRAFQSSPKLRSEFGLVCFGGGPFSKDELEAIGGPAGRGRGTVSNVQGNDAMLAGAYRGASAFVCPSRYEGFGIPIVEAMACGCPVLATPLSSLPEVGGDAIAYTVDSSPDAIRDGLESLLFDQSAMSQARRKGVARAKYFTWESTASETLAGYRAMVR
jgi:glycosyltransferase involved in cell wall biosynthesis